MDHDAIHKEKEVARPARYVVTESLTSMFGKDYRVLDRKDQTFLCVCEIQEDAELIALALEEHEARKYIRSIP